MLGYTARLCTGCNSLSMIGLPRRHASNSGIHTIPLRRPQIRPRLALTALEVRHYCYEGTVSKGLLRWATPVSARVEQCTCLEHRLSSPRGVVCLSPWSCLGSLASSKIATPSTPRCPFRGWIHRSAERQQGPSMIKLT